MSYERTITLNGWLILRQRDSRKYRNDKRWYISEKDLICIMNIQNVNAYVIAKLTGSRHELQSAHFSMSLISRVSHSEMVDFEGKLHSIVKLLAKESWQLVRPSAL